MCASDLVLDEAKRNKVLEYMVCISIDKEILIIARRQQVFNPLYLIYIRTKAVLLAMWTSIIR